MKIIKLEKKHYQWGLTAFLVIVCSFLAFFAIYKFSSVAKFADTLSGVIAPFIYGMVMAYLLCPIYNATVRSSYRIIDKHTNIKKNLTISKAIGSIISVVLLVVVIAGVIWMIIPGLIDSIITVTDILPSAVKNFIRWVDIKFANHQVIRSTVEMYMDYAMDYATNTLIPRTGTMAAEFSAKIMGAVSMMMDFIVGIIVCVYFLNIKDTLAAQFKKIVFAFFSENTADEILSGAEYTNKTFGGYVNGKIIDSAIIGCICFVVMSIFGWEYSLLISSIIGITNIIPFFGPFIGAIPSALLLLMVNPMHALYFAIFIVLLQQFDGNILGPKILGDSTGLASFWILFAILVGGGLFGFIGMVIGVPVFAVIYAYCSRVINLFLKKKGFSIVVDDYKVDKYTNNAERQKLKFRLRGKDKVMTPDDVHEYHAPRAGASKDTKDEENNNN